MKQKRVIQLFVMAVTCALLLIPAASFAGEKVNFSGEWTLNESKSDVGEGRFFSASKMSVTQEVNSIIIESTRAGRNGQERTNSETLSLDGKENVNEGENRSSTSIVTWSDDGTIMTITSNAKFNRQGETFEMKTTQVWTLEEDGKTLKIKSDSSSARGDRSATLAYDKK